MVGQSKLMPGYARVWLRLCCLATNIASLFRESVFRQRAGRPRRFVVLLALTSVFTQAASYVLLLHNSHKQIQALITSTSLSTLLLATLTSSLLLDAIFSFSTEIIVYDIITSLT